MFKVPTLPLLRLLALGVLASAANAGVFPDIGYTPPPTWKGAIYELSQDYPKTAPPPEPQPWKTIDFKTAPKDYMKAVLDYCYEGNVEVDFVVQTNATRKWYQAPWLHTGGNGREFVHGLTRERNSRPFELAKGQTTSFRNYAVGFYNAPGGHVIGKVWSDPDNPDKSAASFPEGTVTFKLLFTLAPASAVPFLVGAPEWSADTDRSPDPVAIAANKVRLLQIDIAVKDNRSLCGGWVFGTFQYDAASPGADAWRKMVPVALMWGNDPALKQSDYNAGARPAESWINAAAPIVAYRSSPPKGATPPAVMGWAGRANGPVDNSVSSCLSCHSTAQIPASSNMTPPNSATETQKLRWFRNLAAGEAFDAGSTSLDFSLQLGMGIQNLEEFTRLARNRGGFSASALRGPREFLGPDEEPAKDWKGARPQQYRFTRDPDPEAETGKGRQP